MEQWVQIKYSKNYSISNKGRVRRDKPGPRTHPGLILKPAEDTYGYYFYRLCENNIYKTCKAHRLVLDHFGPPRPSEKHTVDHINRDKKDNRIENLRWSTPKEQQDNSDQRHPKGVEVTTSKLDEDKVKEIRRIYSLKEGNDPSISLSRIGKQFGVGMQTVHAVVTYRTWKHVD